VSRHDHAIVTRNSYGPLCLNTPNVLFADLDAPWRAALQVPPSGCLVVVLAGLVAPAMNPQPSVSEMDPQPAQSQSSIA
jgi:hypothetical protein